MSFRNYYDSPTYNRGRDPSRSNTSSTSNERPTSVTAKYLNTTPSYKPSSSIPVLSPEKTISKDESPITAIANKYANYNKQQTEKPKYDKKDSKFEKYEKYDKKDLKYEKKDYSKLTVPTITTTKSRDPSPVSSSSKYSLNRSSRRLSPDRRTKSFKDKIRETSPGDRDKDIPSKTDKSTGYNSLSNYKLYPRTSNYTRPTTRTETKPEITVNRYAIANRLSSNYLRSPPTIKRASVSPVNIIDSLPKLRDFDKPLSPKTIIEESVRPPKEPVVTKTENEKPVQEGEGDEEMDTVTTITRHTSPTPPGSSSYVRSRRADMAKTVEKTTTRSKKRPEMVDKEIQSDRLDDPTRTSRFGTTARTSMTNWSYYSPNSSYTGYAGRYSTQYSNLGVNSGSPNSHNERSSRSRSTEPPPNENISVSVQSDSSKDNLDIIPNNNQEIVATAYEQNQTDDTSEIIINVNLKLTRAKSPAVSSRELVSPEMTITNSQLPPQAPKTEGAVKIKKTKVRKSSTDSSSDSGSKRKIVKKRSKSVSSTDSDQGSEVSDKSSPPKSLPKKSSSSNLINGQSKLKHSKSRESNSPESCITLSTQSSISEEETVSKSKTQDASRTSADELSIPTDRSRRFPSPQKNENGTEEAKSFLIRALAPVTNLFKMRQSDSTENTHWPENSTSESTGKDVSNLITESDRSSKSKNIVATNEDNLVQLKGIRPLESSEGGWWPKQEVSEKNNVSNQSHEKQRTPSEQNIPRIRHIESGERAWWMESNSGNKSNDPSLSTNQHNQQSGNTTESSDPNKPFKKCKFIDEEKPWWLDSCANIPEGIERLTPPRKSSSDSDKSEKFNFFKVRHIESGEKKDWWLTSNENSSASNKQENQSLNKSGSDRSFPIRRIRHIESGERPWWLSSSKNIPEGIEKLPTPPPQEESDSSDSEEVQVYTIPSHIPPFPLNLPDDEPLGDRRSPEGLETPKHNEDYRDRSSPYENNRQYRRPVNNSMIAYQKGAERYISRYSDIDDILGTSGQIYSPFMDSILARRTGQMAFEDDECEEIDPTQVRIHDSTAQRPVIKKMHSRSNIIDYRDEDQDLKNEKQIIFVTMKGYLI